MRPLTESEIRALRNLADKHAGNVTPFLRISDAQQLTELGLASRNRQGWAVTAEGLDHLAALDRDGPTPTTGPADGP